MSSKPPSERPRSPLGDPVTSGARHGPALLLAVCLAALPVQGAHGSDRRDALAEGLPEFDFDDEPDTSHVLHGPVTYGVEVKVEYEGAFGFDLERGTGRDEGNVEPSLTATVSYDPSPRFRAAAEIELSRTYEVHDRHDHDDIELGVKQAFLTFREFAPGATVQVGRKTYDDGREWLFDEELDGVRAVYRWSTHAVEGFIAREALVPVDLLEERDGDDEPVDISYLGATTTLGEDSRATIYALYSNDRARDGEDLLFTGVQSSGEIADDVTYWLEAAVVSGDDDGRDVLGYGVDAGITRVFDHPLEPALTVGFAYGSGDDGGGTDGAFRQTGLQDNFDRWNGVAGFDYYGEVLDPELSNLGIATVGAGIRPTKRSSIDLVYHYYFQPERADRFRGTALDADTTGSSGDAGHGLDLILGYREFDDIEIEIAGGAFLPGAAFGEADDPAFFVGAAVDIKF